MKKLFSYSLVILIGLTFSSCMCMMPDHMSGTMPEGHSHDHSTMNTDPVCGKHVDESNAFTYEYQGEKYIFDSESCMNVFKNDPDHFIQKQDQDKKRKSWATAGMVGGAIAMTTMMVLMMVAIF